MSKTKPVNEKPAKKVDDKVALYSEKNLFWNEVGSLKIGYNIVSAEKSERWLQHKAVRLATPEEVAHAYGK
jgi:hypothetical protein